jgi:hypothetical protein
MQRLTKKQVDQVQKAENEMLDNIASICHDANRRLCITFGDHSQPLWEDAPDWQKESARKGVVLHMNQNVGPEASHESWMNEKIENGWKFGPVKDPDRKEHPCIRPFSELGPDQQAKDYLFRGIVHAFKEIFNQPQFQKIKGEV